MTTSMPPPMRLALEASFGSVERWQAAVAAACEAAPAEGTSAALVFETGRGSLAVRSASRETGASAEVPLLAFDRRTDGIDTAAFVAAIDWPAVYERYQHAVHAASELLGANADDLESAAIVIDVRRAGVYAAADSVLPLAQWRDPALVAEWAGELRSGCDVIVYCVYGHEVGRSTAMQLRAAGVKARFLRGGIDGWQAAGRPVVAKK